MRFLTKRILSLAGQPVFCAAGVRGTASPMRSEMPTQRAVSINVAWNSIFKILRVKKQEPVLPGTAIKPGTQTLANLSCLCYNIAQKASSVRSECRWCGTRLGDEVCRPNPTNRVFSYPFTFLLYHIPKIMSRIWRHFLQNMSKGLWELK